MECSKKDEMFIEEVKSCKENSLQNNWKKTCEYSGARNYQKGLAPQFL